MKTHARVSGFTMLELSIVIVIIALITGMGTVATLNLLENTKQISTEKKMDEIERALQNFRNKNNRLPCPADITLAKSNANYGVEALPLGGCVTGTPAAVFVDNYGAEGTVPVKALGLPDGFMYDGWGRKFRYMVDINATYADAFNIIKPKEFCEIVIKDSAGNAITGNSAYSNGAMYALLSHGANGHGGYTETGVIINSGSADTDEQNNCRCDGTGANVDALEHAIYIQKEATATFDDIVRYKERWQMMNDNDAKLASTYAGPDMAIALTQNGSNNVKLFEQQCGQLKAYTGTPPANYTTNAAVATVGLAFTKNNSYLFTYNGNASAGRYCDIYAIDNKGTVGTAETGSTGIDCSTFGTTPVMDMSEGGYLVVGLSSSPYARFWRFSNGKFIQEADTSPAMAFTAVLSAAPTRIAVSKNGSYVVVNGAAYTRVYYKNASGQYALMGTPSGGGFAVPGVSFAFTDNEDLLAVSKATTVYLWPIYNAYNYMGSVITKAVTATTSAMDFSPDGKYLAVVGSGPSSGTNYNTRIRIYKIDAISSTYITDITPSGTFSYTGGSFTDVAFSKDSNYLVIPYTGGSGSDRAMVFKRTGHSSFQELKNAQGTNMPLSFSVNAGESPYKVKFAN